MSLDVSLYETRRSEVWDCNLTHNLAMMAQEAGLREYLWDPHSLGIVTASQLIQPLRDGLERLVSAPVRFMKMDLPDDGGSYEELVDFVAGYLRACECHPNADISISR